MYSYVKLNFRVGLFSCIFLFEAIFCCFFGILYLPLFTWEKWPKVSLNYAARKKFPVPTALTVLTNFISVGCAFKVVSSTLSREYDLIFGNLGIEESEVVTNVTGCLKPCHFKKYIFLGDRTPSSFKSEHYIFSLWAVSSKTKVEKEELIYPMSTLVAEFGGTLGLFLGFSFISVWDNFDLLKKFVAYLGQRNK